VTRVAVAVLCACTAPLASQSPRIEDNSFLIEEAYNQERGVVQHISAWERSLGSSAWGFAFTQEWPLVTTKSRTYPRHEVGAEVRQIFHWLYEP